MTLMRRHYVASTSLRRHVPAGPPIFSTFLRLCICLETALKIGRWNYSLMVLDRERRGSGFSFICLFNLSNANQAPRYKKNFMLNSAEHEISNAHKYKISRNSAFSNSDKPIILFFLLMPTIAGILTFMSRKKFLLS